MNLTAHTAKTAAVNSVYRPEIYRLNNTQDTENFHKLLASGPLFIHNEIEVQLMELIKIRHPSRQLSAGECRQLAVEHAGYRLDEYGVWVHYPWNNRLVHLLPEAEFVEVRTARNKYKITAEEQQILEGKRIGVIGLSVGQSVALCIAMERAAGEFRLADFDTLELSNLNRIRTSLANLGAKKAIVTAREIAEMDPFLNVSVFEEGLNEENLDAFMLHGGKLHAVIDECDGIAMKIACRKKARDLGVPVLMEASDRCTIDVERYDLEPDRPLLHGYIDHLDLSRVSALKTNEEKVPYLAPMVGVDTMSARLKASALEVGHSITTWPQLASAVGMGGGALADVWRRLALDLFRQSGRYFIDVEALIGGPPAATDTRPNLSRNADLRQPGPGIHSQDDCLRLANRFLQQELKPGAAILTPPPAVIRELVKAATWAPSGGNSQPWKWVAKQGILFLFLDRQAGFSYMNFRESASYIALGAATENLILAAHRRQLRLRGRYFPLPDEPDLVAAFSFHAETDRDRLEPVIDDSLVHVIEKRQTNRKTAPRKALPQDLLDQLAKMTAHTPGASLKFIDSIGDILEIGRIIGITDRYRILHPESNYDFTHREIRWTAEEARRSGTGIDVQALELKETELLGLRFIRDEEVITFLSKINGGQLLKNASVKHAASASAFGLLTVPAFAAGDFFTGGRVSQRVWLKATQLGLAFQPMNVPLAYFARLKHDPASLPAGTADEIRTLYARFTTLFGYESEREEIYLFRIFKADEPILRSHRRPLEEILCLA